jgi:REP element-mobilizing transposase RayT
VGGRSAEQFSGFSRNTAMPYVKVWIHFVWTTKNRLPLLTDGIRAQVFQHIRENARQKGIFIDHINGWREHVHCLISLGTDQTIAQIVKLLKGESSRWINQQNLCPAKFQWQHEYFAVSVCESILDKTRDYIKNQEVHHSKKPFEDEFEAMLAKYGFQRFKDDNA